MHLLNSLLAILAFTAVAVSKNISLDVPSVLNSTLRAIDGSWQSFSIEFSYMADYFGNKSLPNSLSYNLLQNLKDRSERNVIIRAGGSTANRVVYNASQPEAVVNVFGSNADQPSHVYIGPIWYEAFQTAPNGTKVIYDVNYRDNSTTGINNTINECKRVWALLKDDLYAFELGNEVEGWANSGRSSDWSPALYVPDYLNYTNLIDNYVWGDEAEEVEPFFQGGVLQGSGGAWINEPWNSLVLLDLDLNQYNQMKAMSQHDYHGSNCDTTTQIPELRQNLLNHTNVINRVWPHQQMSPVVEDQGIEYVLGETNSISCQGRDLVSNVFGSALWYLDYNLYVAASTEVARMYFHQGTPYRYSLWAPYEGATNNSALIRPSYYGALLLATAIGGNGAAKQVHPLVQEETLVAYSLYARGRLDSVIVVNMEPYNATTSGERPYVSVALSGSTRAGKVLRLTADGSDVKSDVTWAGQTVTKEGKVSGDEISEAFRPGQVVKLQDSEAILIKF